MWRFVLAAVFVLAVDGTRVLEFLDRTLTDLRFGLANRPATEQIVIVGIDAESLATFDQWPWPRSLHAALIDRLIAAGVAKIGVDIDFSSRSTADEDEALAAALARAGPDRVALPLVREPQQMPDGSTGFAEVTPYTPFLAAVTGADANAVPDANGQVRRLARARMRGDIVVPSLASWVTPKTVDLGLEAINIDFSIDVETLPYFNYVDILAGRFDPSTLRGRSVLVGAVDLVLGDQASVPRYSVLPGVIVHAMAAETLLQDRSLSMIGGLATSIPVVLFVLIVGPWLARRSRTTQIVVMSLVLFLVIATTTLLQPAAAIVVELAPFLVAWSLTGLCLLLDGLQRERALKRAAAREAKRQQALFRGAFENSFDGIITFSPEGDILQVNQSAETLLQRSAEDAVGANLRDVLPMQADLLTSINCDDGKVHEDLTITRPDGSRIVVDIACRKLCQQDIETVNFAAMRDVSIRKAQTSALTHLASHDQLTGMPNRYYFRDRLENAIDDAKIDGTAIACIFVDLDRFKEINDTLGHSVGDLVLEQVAPRLRQVCADRHFAARLGGDEFALLLINTSRDVALQVAQRIFDVIREPFHCDDETFSITASIGFALFPSQATDRESLMRMADIAMYRAKQNQLAFAEYDQELDPHSQRRLQIGRDLGQAVASGQIFNLYQPKVDVRSLALVGVEVLVRWQHPRLGLIPPPDFISLAERSGMIDELTLRILEMAVQQGEDWQSSGLRIPFAVNLSAVSLSKSGFVQDLISCVDRNMIERLGVSFEITESSVVDSDDTLSNIFRLRDAGFELALDDFGTGYSSYAYLGHLPISLLKIDRAFLRGGGEDSNSNAVLTSMVELAQRLGIDTLAEGVEDARMLEQLAAVSCDYAQGFYLGKPVDAEKIAIWPCGTDFVSAGSAQAAGVTLPS